MDDDTAEIRRLVSTIEKMGTIQTKFSAYVEKASTDVSQPGCEPALLQLLLHMVELKLV
jgi:hypothetical protein